MIGVPEGEDRATVPAHEPQPGRDVVELREVERDVEDVVLEPVRERPGAPVLDLADEQVGPPAAISTGVRAAASAGACSGACTSRSASATS